MMNDLDIDADRISTLPIEITHDIMGRLTMLDTVQTNCLSKAWKSFGDSLPYLNIDHNRRAPPHSSWFRDFMARKVSSMSAQGKSLAVYKFKLCLDHFIVYGAREEVERCIKLVSKTNTIQEFDFQITRVDRHNMADGDTYSIHQIYNSKTLNVLRLGGLTLTKPSGDMKLLSLQSLSLKNVNIDREYGIGGLFSSFPMVREMRLIDCNCLKNLKVSGLSHLKHLEISSCHLLVRVEIHAPGLEKLVLSEIRRLRNDDFVLDFEIDSQTCETLKELTLCNSTIRGSTFSRTFSGCKNVESLVLDWCLRFFKIRIASQKLRNLVVRRCLDLLVTEIDAPNLTSFSFCNFCWDDFYCYFPVIEKILQQQKCMLDFTEILRTKSIWSSLWFDKFNDIQGQKMVIYPDRSYKVAFVLEDWSCIAELPLMTKICEEATKTIITTMSFLDLADYVLESNENGGNKLENVITISSTDESKFYEAMKKKRPTISCKRLMAKKEVADIAGFSYQQTLLETWMNGNLEAIQFDF